MPPAAPGCSGCAARDEEIALLREQAEAQRARISELEEKVARLERLLSRNSGNSSMPPSADDLPGRKQPQDRKRGKQGKRRPGKQPLRHEAQCYIPRSARRDWRYVSGSDG